ncbi:MAG: phenylalanine--tRNA ligase subunit beta [Candidatus Omnitrophica bacterium]|nr:phenylalanine--tRNA ligase subunit beta [Candidatus Omnitrophota bacterium]
MRVSFNWLKDYVDIRMQPEQLAQKLTMAGLEITSATRIDQDTIWEIEVTPNRTDCLSILGIAREVAALTGKKLKLPKIGSLRGSGRGSIPIQIADKRLCPFYLGRVIKNIQVQPSPSWLRANLEMMGVRSVNNIVDITNFCLLELGQPLHAFDLDKLSGQRLIIRRAQAKEELITIDGMSRQLESPMLVVADKTSIQAIAGIMGGKSSEVTEATTNILLESAYFDALSVHHTSRKLGLATQSSYRFERGVDAAGVTLASLRATQLIKKIAGTKKKKSKAISIGKLIKKGKKVSQLNNRVRLRYQQASELLGIEIPPAEIKEILRALQFKLVRKSPTALMVEIPSFRPDLSREADLIEEIARLYSYERIPTKLGQFAPDLARPVGPGLSSGATNTTDWLLRQILSALGLHEIMTYSLISRQALRKLGIPEDNIIRVKNPLSYEQEVMRPTLLAGMLSAFLCNLNRKNKNLKLFELSRIYFKQDSRTRERASLAIGVGGKKPDNWMHKMGEYSFFDLKGVVEALLLKLGVPDLNFQEAEAPIFIPGRTAFVLAGDKNLGLLGEVKNEILEKFDITSCLYLAELNLEELRAQIHQEKRFVPLAKFPAAARDVSFFAPPEVSSDEIAALIKKIGRGLVAQVSLFDQYFGEQIPPGFRALSFSIEYRSDERTLTAEEVDKLHAQIRQALNEELKVELR